MKQLLCFLFFLVPQIITAQCEHPDYTGLMALYEATNGEEWKLNGGWKEASNGMACDPCDYNGGTWDFVYCQNGRVREIYFNSNNLQGQIPEIALGEIEEITIIENRLIESIPSFSNMPKLKSLTIKRCELGGELPDFSALQMIQNIEITGNKLSSSIPNFNLPQLESLDLTDNELTGSIPNFNLNKLTSLTLSTNKLSGEIPKFENLPALVSFNCSNNIIEGEIHNFEHNQDINRIDIVGNLISGPVPDFKDFPGKSILIFRARNNNLSGCYPESVCSLFQVDFNDNPKLPFRGNTDKICDGSSKLNAPCTANDSTYHGVLDENCICHPVDCDAYEAEFDALMEFYNATNGDEWFVQTGWMQAADGFNCFPCDYSNRPWFGIKCEEGKIVAIDMDGMPDFTNLGMGGNGLVGPVTDLSLPDLQELYLDDNQLSGQLHDFINASQIETLILSRNNLSGGLPDFSDFPNLKVFRGSFNNFTGPISDLTELDGLQTFTCSNNLLAGCLNDALCDIELVDLKGNDMLPWSGDIDTYCMDEDEIGAPCNLSADEDYFINENCECVLFTSNINDLELNGIEVFPNPASDFININTQFNNVTFTILNIQGVKHISSKQKIIDVSQLPKGIYFISVEEEKNAAIKFYKI